MLQQYSSSKLNSQMNIFVLWTSLSFKVNNRRTKGNVRDNTQINDPERKYDILVEVGGLQECQSKSMMKDIS